MKKKSLALILAAFMLLTLLSGCGGNSTESTPAEDTPTETTPAPAEKTVITVGCMAREEPDILFVAEKLKDSNYEIKTQIFSDAPTSNLALDAGEIDANFNQHINYLNMFNEEKGTHLVAAGDPVSTYPFGIYSRKHTSLEELPDGAVIAISNDSVNRPRELQLLAAVGLIELAEGVDDLLITDITSNPKNLEIMEIDTYSKLAVLDDVDAVLLNAITVYLNDDPEKPLNKLATEDLEVTRALAGTLVAVHESNKDAEWAVLMNEVMHSDEYAKHLADTYHGAKVPMFETDAFIVE